MRNSTLSLAIASLLAGAFTGWFLAPSLIPASTHTQILNVAADSSTPPPPAVTPSTVAVRPDNEFMTRLHDVLSIGNRAKREHAILSVADGMSVAEIGEALDRLETVHLRERNRIRKLLLARWGELDPQNAVAYAMRVANQGDRITAVNAVLGGWLENDAKSAEAWIVNLPNGPVKREAMEELVESLGVSDPRHALQLAQDPRNVPFRGYGISPDGGSPLVHALFDKWLDDDPEAAAAAAVALPNSVHFRDTALHVIGKRWAEKDLEAALAWADLNSPAMDNAEHQNNPRTGVLAAWLKSDPTAAIAWLNDSPDGDGKVGLVRSMVSHIYTSDPATAMELSIVIPPGSMREKAIVQTARNWLASEPQSAAKWALQQEDDSIRRMALRSVAAEWMRNDLAGAREWINSLPRDATTDTMLRDAFGMLANGVSWAGSSYMGDGFFSMMSSDGIQGASQMIDRISDVTQREAAYAAFAGRWMAHDPKAAAAWVDGLPVSDAQKAKLKIPAKSSFPPRR